MQMPRAMLLQILLTLLLRSLLMLKTYVFFVLLFLFTSPPRHHTYNTPPFLSLSTILQSYDAAEFDALIEKYEKLNWRIISKPGGATVKPDEFYSLYGYHMQASQGDNTAERPMWAEKGGLDFEGRARWDAWTAVKGTAGDKAKLEFVKTYYEFPVKCLYTDTRGK